MMKNPLLRSVELLTLEAGLWLKKKKKLSNGEVLTQVSQPYQSHAHIPNSQGLKDQ